MALLGLLHVCLYFALALIEAAEVSVEAPAGTFVGTKGVLDDGREVRKFLGIPYAEPPVGDRRFKKPIPKARLTQPYDATALGPTCLGYYVTGSEYMGTPEKQSEDCLFLNVFVPTGDPDETAGRAVMIWIHGGAFLFGSSDAYSGDTLGSFGNVIVVTLNYRLAVWGFLSFSTEDSPGNFGLWDQHQAIRWVHENIRAFGGDPNRVTVFGNSAGSASVIYQCLYPGNTNLFQRAIAQSGNIFASWAFVNYPQTLDVAKLYAKTIGCDDDQVSDTVKCLRSKTSEETENAYNDMIASGHVAEALAFKPSLDRDFIKVTPRDYIYRKSEAVSEKLKFSFPVDLMTGVTNGEGNLFFRLFGLVDDPENFRISQEAFETAFVPHVLKVTVDEDLPKDITRHMADAYTIFKDSSNDDLRRKTYMELLSHAEFVMPGILTARIHAGDTGENRTFFYHFTAQPRRSVFPVPSWSSGANHVDDVPFVFGYDKGLLEHYLSYNGDFSVDQWEKELSSCVMTLWSNFAKSGNPNSPAEVKRCIGETWPVFNLKEQSFLEITENPETNSVKQKLHEREYSFWHGVLPDKVKEIREERQAKMATEDKDQVCHKDGTCPP